MISFAESNLKRSTCRRLDARARGAIFRSRTAPAFTRHCALLGLPWWRVLCVPFSMLSRPQINSDRQLRIGHGMRAGNASSVAFFCADDIEVGTRVELCYAVLTVNHRLNDLITIQKWSACIERNSWIGENTPSVFGITSQERAIIGVISAVMYDIFPIALGRSILLMS